MRLKNMCFNTRKKSYQVAKSIMKEKAVSFYQAFSKLKGQKFQAVCGVYAFCRHVDDLVDGLQNSKNPTEEKQSVLMELDRLEHVLQNLDHGDGSDGLSYPWWDAFQDTFVKYQMKAEPFFWQIQGQRLDLDFHGFSTMEELIQYSKLVAGSVGLMMLPILVDRNQDRDNQKLVDACIRLGIGMQLTNILRDIGEDLKERNRIYIPDALLKEFQLAKEDLKDFYTAFATTSQEERFERFKKLWEALSQKTTEYYTSFSPLIYMYEKTCRIPLLAAAKIYHSIEDAVRENGYDCFTRRCYSSIEKRRIILKQVREDIARSNLKYK